MDRVGRKKGDERFLCWVDVLVLIDDDVAQWQVDVVEDFIVVQGFYSASAIC